MTRAEEIIEEILRADLEPPDDSYNPFDYGRKVAERLSLEERKKLFAMVLRRLASTTAQDFLEGLLCHGCPFDRADDLISLIPEAKQVDSAAFVVEVLRDQLGTKPHELSWSLLDHLDQAETTSAQDRLGYAIHVGLPVQSMSDALRQRLIRLLDENELSKYCKDILNEKLNHPRDL